MKPEGNRDIFAKAGKLGPFFRPADKTADYFRKLLGHWDAIAVDTGQRKLLAQANLVPFYSTLVAYKEKRTILQLTALNLDSRPIDLDSSIYKYYVDTNKMKGTAQQPQNLPKRGGKYCHNCGHRLFDLDTFCTKCGTKQH